MIVPGAAADLQIITVDVERIIARTAAQDVRAGIPHQHVVAGTADQGIVAGATGDPDAPGRNRRIQHIVAGTADGLLKLAGAEIYKSRRWRR